MNNLDLGIRILHDPFTISLKMVFYSQTTKDIVLHNFCTKQDIVLEKGARIPEEYIFEIPFPYCDVFKQAMRDFLDKEGIQSKEESFTKGKLDATLTHLKDLRHILKLDKDRS